jgi:hypothetical protein
MTKIQINRSFAVGAVALGAVALGATAIGALAIGALSIGRLRMMEGRLENLYVRRLTIGELDIQSDRSPEGS